MQKEKKEIKKEKNVIKNKKEEQSELIQWHPAFCSAMKLELIKNKKDLSYHSEYGLNSKPILVDLLVIRKEENVVIENEIGKIFKGHNIFEYKSPDDEMNVDTYFKVLGYACLYKAQAEKVNGIVAEDITISMIREAKPIGMFRWFKEQGYDLEERYKGIYYIRNYSLFATQVIVLGELDPPVHMWLTALSKKLTKERTEQLVMEINGLSEKDECEFADSVLQVAMKANKEMFQEVKEADDMCEELIKLMEPELNEAKRIAKEEGRKAGMEAGKKAGMEAGKKAGMEAGKKAGMELGIEGFIKLLKKYNESDENILEELMATYEFTKKEAEEYLENYNRELH